MDKNKTDKLLKLLGKVLKDHRLKTDLSMTMLGYENGVQKSLISRLEKGQNEPNFFSLWCVAEALEIPLSKLLEEVEKELPEDWYLLDK